MNTVPQHVEKGKVLVRQGDAVKFIVKDGVYFNPAINEWEVWLDDEPAFPASTEAIAKGLYREALRVRKDHYERNLANADDIPFLGEPVAIDDDHAPAGTRYGLDRSEW